MKGHIDVLVNNAGVVLVKPFDQITWDEFRRTTEVNLGGHFLLCKYVLPYMKKQKSGVIVNMGSVSGHVGQTDHVMYGATKGAIIAMTRALAWELAPYNIRVNSISPGSVDTPMLRGDIDLESKRTGHPIRGRQKGARSRTGLQALGRPGRDRRADLLPGQPGRILRHRRGLAGGLRLGGKVRNGYLLVKEVTECVGVYVLRNLVCERISAIGN